MKKLYRLTFCCLLSVLYLPGSWAATDDATAIIHKSWQLYRQHSETEVEDIKLEIQRPDRASKLKTLTRWTHYSADGEQVVVKFNSPSIDKGLGLLIDRNTARQQMWLKMPSWKKARRISGNRWQQYFAGTDLTFEDNAELSGENTDNYQYSLKTADINGWKITAKPVNSSRSGYYQRDIWVSPDYAITRIDYYKQAGSISKTLRNLKIQMFSDGAWRPARIEVDNISKNRKTFFDILSREFEQKLNARTFSERFLRE